MPGVAGGTGLTANQLQMLHLQGLFIRQAARRRRYKITTDLIRYRRWPICKSVVHNQGEPMIMPGLERMYAQCLGCWPLFRSGQEKALSVILLTAVVWV